MAEATEIQKRPNENNRI